MLDNKVISWGILIIMILIFTGSCVPPPKAGVVGETNVTTRVERFIDKEAGAVCWVYRPAWEAGGISCLPLDQTNLSQ